MFDALGFKGIWQRPEVNGNPEVVIRKLEHLDREVNLFLDAEFHDRKRAAANDASVLGACSAAFLSDTVVLGLAHKNEHSLKARSVSDLKLWSTLVATRFVATILRAAAILTPSLAYRGVVTYGQFRVRGNFVVGSAVDAAAEAMNCAQAAIVSLAPDITELLNRRFSGVEAFDKDQGGLPLIRYRVPLKGGGCMDTFAVVPFFPRELRSQRRVVINAVLETFTGGRPDVEEKRHHTATFLNEADRLFGDPGGAE